VPRGIGFCHDGCAMFFDCTVHFARNRNPPGGSGALLGHNPLSTFHLPFRLFERRVEKLCVVSTGLVRAKCWPKPDGAETVMSLEPPWVLIRLPLAKRRHHV